MNFPTGPSSYAGYPSMLGINAYECNHFLVISSCGTEPSFRVSRRLPCRPTEIWPRCITSTPPSDFLYRSQNPHPVDLVDRPGLRDAPEYPAELGGISAPVSWQHSGRGRPDVRFERRCRGQGRDLVGLHLLGHRSCSLQRGVCPDAQRALRRQAWSNIPLTPPVIGR